MPAPGTIVSIDGISVVVTGVFISLARICDMTASTSPDTKVAISIDVYFSV